jgi:hypothetical protein
MGGGNIMANEPVSINFIDDSNGQDPDHDNDNIISEFEVTSSDITGNLEMGYEIVSLSVTDEYGNSIDIPRSDINWDTDNYTYSANDLDLSGLYDGTLTARLVTRSDHFGDERDIEYFSDTIIKNASTPIAYDDDLERYTQTFVNYNPSHDQTHPSMTTLNNGDYIVAWGSNGNISLQHFNENGEKTGDEVQVNTTSTADLSCITALNNGGYVISWTSHGDTFLQRFNIDGEKTGDEIRVNTYTDDSQNDSSITALNDGGYVVSWTSHGQDGSGYGIYLQRFSVDGNKIGDEVQVNTYTQNTQHTSSISALNDGGYIVTWSSFDQDFTSGYGVYLQRFSAEGVKIGDETQVNTYVGTNQWKPVITSLQDGGYVIAWQSYGQDGSGNGIYLQRFNANGEKLGDETQVNTTTDNSQFTPSVVALDDGGFIVSWNSYEPNRDTYDICLQRYNSNGEQVGEEVLVNTATVGSYMHSAITALDDGGYIVTWTGATYDGHDHIFSQRFHDNGSKQMPDTIIINPIDILNNDIDGNILSITQVNATNETHGTVTINEEGNIVYTPDAHYNGPASFEYTISDGHDEDSATVTLTVDHNNAAPVAIDDNYIDFPTPAFREQFDSEAEGYRSFDENSIALESDFDHTFDTQLTISSWIRLDGNIDNYGRVVEFGEKEGEYYKDSSAIAFGSGERKNIIRAWTNNEDDEWGRRGYIEFDMSPYVNDGEFHLVTYTFDNAFAKFYVDGSLVSSHKILYPLVKNIDDPDTINIGGYNGSDQWNFNGDIDGVGVFDTALTSAQIQALYGAGTGSVTPAIITDSEILEGETIIIKPSMVLANDIDDDRDTLTITEVTATGDTHGSVFINDDGDILFVSDANYEGFITFEYTVSDGYGGEDTATARLKVDGANDNPVAVNDAPVEPIFTQTYNSEADGYKTFTHNSNAEESTFTHNFTTQLSINAWVKLDGNVDNYARIVEFGDKQGDYYKDSTALAFGAGNKNLIRAWTNETGDDGGRTPEVNFDMSAYVRDGQFHLVSYTFDNRYARLYIDGVEVAIKEIKNPIESIQTPETINIGGYDGGSEWSLDGSIDGVGVFDTALSATQIGAIYEAGVGSIHHELLTTREDTPLVIDPNTLLENDSDIDGDALTITSVQNALHGTVLLNDNGTITFTPDTSYDGPASFEYTVSDGHGGESTATVEMTIQPNQSPIAVDDHIVNEPQDPVQVNTYTQDSQYDPSIATLNDGGYIVSWTSYGQDGSGDGIYLQRYNAYGERVGEETLINTDTQGVQDESAITALNDGGYVVSWSSRQQYETDVYIQQFNRYGETVSNETLVNTTTDFSQNKSTITPLQNGGYVVSWLSWGIDYIDAEIHLQQFDSAGEKVGVETLVYAVYTTENISMTTLPNNDILIAWNDPFAGNSYIQRYDVESHQASEPILIHSYDSTFYGTEIETTSLINGDFVVSWESKDDDGQGVYLQQYNSNGEKTGEEVLVNTSIADTQTQPVITGISDGGYVVSWQSYNMQVTSLYLQRFNSDGEKVGGEILVDEYTNYFAKPSITALDDGGYVITYTSTSTSPREDESNIEIYMQRYDADGTPWAPNFHENRPVTVDQETLLANDNDPDNDTLTITSVNATDDTHGTVSFDGEDITYVPYTDYVGDVSFEYSVRDGHGGEDTATVNLTIESDTSTPTVESITNDTAYEGESLTHTVTLTHATNEPTEFTFEIDDGIGNPYYSLSEISFNDPNIQLYGGTITLPSGIENFDITIPVHDNGQVDNEPYAIMINIGDKMATGTISDPDEPEPTSSILPNIPEDLILDFDQVDSMPQQEPVKLESHLPVKDILIENDDIEIPLPDTQSSADHTVTTHTDITTTSSDVSMVDDIFLDTTNLHDMLNHLPNIEDL